MASFGKILKYFRESKGLSLKDAAGDVLSSSQISRFERDLTSLNVESFYKVLRNINISLTEFELMYKNHSQISELQSNLEISKAYLEGNISKLEAILDRLNFDDARTAYLDAVVVKTAIFMCDSERKVCVKDIEAVTDYLFSIEEWGNYELWLFANTSFVLSPESLNLLGSEMINRTHFYNSSEENKRKISIMTLNITSTLLDLNETSYALKFLNYIDRLAIPETETYLRMFHKYVKFLYQYKIGNEKAKHELEKIVEALEILECYATAKKIKAEINEL